MTNEIAAKPTMGESIERVLMTGDLSALNPQQRVDYYFRTCESLGLNPLTKPFDYLKLNGKTVLYANKDGAAQLRRIGGISITDVQTKVEHGLITVTVFGRDKDGRSDVEIGVVPCVGLQGDALGNAQKKAMTQAKRRLTLSLQGMGMLDESETEQIPGARQLDVNHITGEIVGAGSRIAPTAPAPEAAGVSALMKRAMTTISRAENPETPITDEEREYLLKAFGDAGLSIDDALALTLAFFPEAADVSYGVHYLVKRMQAAYPNDFAQKLGELVAEAQPLDEDEGGI